MIGGDHSTAAPTILTMIEIGAYRETCVRKMTCDQAHRWSNQLIDCGFVIEQSNAFRTVFFNHRTRLRVWSMSSAPQRTAMPIII